MVEVQSTLGSSKHNFEQRSASMRTVLLKGMDGGWASHRG